MCDVLYSQSHAFKRVQYHQIRIYERSWAQKTDSSKHKKMSGKKRERERVRRISESPAVFVLYTVYELNGILSPVFTHTSAIFKIQAHDYMDRLSAK